MNLSTKLIAFGLPSWAVLLLIFHLIIRKQSRTDKRSRLWTALCFVPLLACVVDFLLNAFFGNFTVSLDDYRRFYAYEAALPYTERIREAYAKRKNYSIDMVSDTVGRIIINTRKTM